MRNTLRTLLALGVFATGPATLAHAQQADAQQWYECTTTTTTTTRTSRDEDGTTYTTTLTVTTRVCVPITL